MSSDGSVTSPNRRGTFRTGLRYTRRSFEFQLRHPVVIALGALQLVVVWGGMFGISGLLLNSEEELFRPTAVVGIIAGYLVISTFTTLTNAVITAYVFAAEMGTPNPLAYALRHVRRHFSALLGYAALSATVLSAVRFGMGFLRGNAIVGETVGALIESTVLAAWYASTIFAVPVLLFEEGTSLRRTIPRSASLLRESKWAYASSISAWPVMLVFFVVGVGALVYWKGTVGLFALAVTAFTGFVVNRIFTSIFKAYIYGEIAGPFSL